MLDIAHVMSLSLEMTLKCNLL